VEQIVTAKSCITCANAACERAGLVEVCDEWTNTDDETEEESLAAIGAVLKGDVT
jgi:hypothetical protein